MGKSRKPKVKTIEELGLCEEHYKCLKNTNYYDDTDAIYGCGIKVLMETVNELNVVETIVMALCDNNYPAYYFVSNYCDSLPIDDETEEERNFLYGLRNKIIENNVIGKTPIEEIIGVGFKSLLYELNLFTVEDLLEATPFEGLYVPLNWNERQRWLAYRVVEMVAYRVKEDFPELVNAVSNFGLRVLSSKQFASNEMHEFLEKKGCDNLYQVTQLSSNDFNEYSNTIEVRDYLRKLSQRGWYLLDYNSDDYGIETYIVKYFDEDVSELSITDNMISALRNAQIETVCQLCKYTRSDLLEKEIITKPVVYKLINALQEKRFLLSGDTFRNCSECGVELVVSGYKEDEVLCKNCAEKKKHILKSKTVSITIKGPEYGSYTNLDSGFTLFATIENMTDEFKSIELVDFYVFSNSRQQSPMYYLNGYRFENEYLFPHTAKTVGEIFARDNLTDNYLQKDDYLIIRLKVDDNRDMMFKYVYDGIEEWKFDDYHEKN